MSKWILTTGLVLQFILFHKSNSLKIFNSDSIEDEDQYCFYLHIHDNVSQKFNTSHHNLINFCIRINLTEYKKNALTEIFPYMSFADLEQKNISVNQLSQWSTSIDIVENYQMYLMNITNTKSLERFYNCTKSLFGPICQFQFYYTDSSFFDQLQNATLPPFWWVDEDSDIISKLSKKEHVELLESCYTGLKCHYNYPLPMCLDWREICDGKVDCLNGIDEENCFKLELNECEENEYRCHNGAQCIPHQFWRDDPLYPDCLDRTDEIFDYSDVCYQEPSIRCEEHACRPDTDAFICGDGQCGLSFCKNERFTRFQLALFSKPKSPSINNNCWDAMKIIMQSNSYKEIQSSTNDAFRHCPFTFAFPSYPVALGHVCFIYIVALDHYNKKHGFTVPTLVCYDQQLCPNFSTIHSLPLYKNNTLKCGNRTSTCHYFHDLPIVDTNRTFAWIYLRSLVENLFSSSCFSYDQKDFKDQINCSSYSQLYQCIKSIKCISKHRLLDGIRDCPLGDDENFPESCSLTNQKYRFKCEELNRSNICISPLLFEHKEFQCSTRLDQRKQDVPTKKFSGHSIISFQTLCDGFEERLPLLINNENETDETNCNENIWPCQNLYTQCDGYWNCLNGVDEVGCPSPFNDTRDTVICNPMDHICVSPKNRQLRCLNLSKINNGIIDCLGGFDERQWCRKKYNHPDDLGKRFLCSNSQIPKKIDLPGNSDVIECLDIYSLCDGYDNCYNDEDELCLREQRDYCESPREKYKTRMQHILCGLDETHKPTNIHFALIPNTDRSSNRNIQAKSNSPTHFLQHQYYGDEHLYKYHRLCNRGVAIKMREGKMNDWKIFCLCPPSYYGLNCEYQSQRIGLTLQFDVLAEWRTVFKFMIVLIDSDYTIHSFEQLTYASIRDCHSKFSFYLLYKSRFKNENKNYSIRIDAFLADKLQYRASWIYPIKFLFLPVHRLAFLLHIPDNPPNKACSLPCGNHGVCTTYENNKKEFCRCDSGWTGFHCHIEYQCECSSDALCMGSSLSCLCSLHKYGRRCYLKQRSCESTSTLCFNGGICLPVDIRFDEKEESFQCICPNAYSGNQCQYENSRIDIKFSKEIIKNENFLSIHLITANGKYEHQRTTMLSRVNFEQTHVRFYTSIEYQIIFAQIKAIYYLISLLPNYIPQRNLSIEILSSQRCSSIDQLFNSTIINFHPLRRVKYYHLPCRESAHLPCFYDLDTFMCLCTNNSHANCFNFDFNLENECTKRNYCLNKGYCFQDHLQCPTISICVCEDCFYGSRCQFSTKGFGLSLDAILGYHIQANITFSNQSKPVKTSLVLVIVIFSFGVTNAFLSIITFCRKSPRQTGCGMYLLSSSVICLLIMFIFLLKFIFLLLIQSETIVQSWILKINCILMDFLLRILLNMEDWMNACVAIERVFTVSKGIHFDKRKSKKMSKWIISSIIIGIILTGIHDPIHRRLIFDEDEHRTWCIVDYQSNSILQYYDSIFTILHFLSPFLIHFFSSLLIIILIARRRSLSHKDNFLTHLQKQFQEHSHLIISSCILIILALPRLIISLDGGCMKSARNPWLFLVGYFISFIPSMLFFIVFVLTSKTYKKDFKQATRALRQIIQT